MTARLVLHDGHIVACNKDAQELFDCERQALLGQSVLAFAAPLQADGRPAPELLQEKRKAALTLAPQSFNWLGQRPSGDTFAALATLSRMEVRGKLLVELTLEPVAAAAPANTPEDEVAGLTQAPTVILEEEEPVPVETAVAEAPPLENRALADESLVTPPSAKEISPKKIVVEAVEAEGTAEETQGARLGEQFLKFRLGIERTNDAVFMTDVDGTITYVNPAFERIYGFSAEEAIGQTPRILKSGVLPQETYETFWRQLLDKEVVAGEIINRTADDRLIHIEGANNPILDEDGQLVGFLGIHRDISERKRAEEALRAARQELEDRVTQRTADLSQANAMLTERNAELEQVRRQVQQRSEILEVLHDLSRHVAAEPENLKPFEYALGKLAKLIDATSAHLYALHSEQGLDPIAEYYSPTARAEESLAYGPADGSLLRETTSVRRRLIEAGETYIRHAGDPALSAAERTDMIQHGVASILGIPLEVGEAAAVLEFWDSGEKRPFSRDEVALVQTAASQLAVPLENARLYAQVRAELAERRQLEQQIQASLERRSRQVQLSTQVAKDVVAATNLEDLYERVVTQVKEQFGFYHVQLLRYEPAVKAVVLIAGYGDIGRKMLSAGHRMPMGAGLIGRAAQTGKSVLSAEVTEDPNWRSNPLLSETRSELAVPIMLGDEILGVLDVQSSQAHGLDEEDQLVMEGLCGQIAVAIESTRLRQDMADQLEELTRLQRIMSREGWLSFRAQHEGAPLGYRFSRASLRSVEDEDAPVEPLARETAAERQETLAKPMRVRGEIIGALGISDDPDHPLAPEDQELLDAISVQVAEALESARLLEQIQRHAVEMEAVAQVSAAASTILDAPKLLQTVTSLTRERFDLYHVGIFIPEEERLAKAAGASHPSAPESDLLPADIVVGDEDSAVVRAAADSVAVVVNDLHAGDGFAPNPRFPAARSELAIPLVVGGQVLGVLDLLSEASRRFGEDDVRIHTTLAAQVAVAFQNANLYARQLEIATRLREVDRLKSQFLASMSHELRTPLNSIIGFADVLLEGIDGPLNERMNEDVTLIRDSGRHLRALIGEMLDMSKIEAGMMELRHESIHLPLLAREVIANAKGLALGKELTIDLELDSGLDTIQADRTRLTQILLNLLSNAVKFTKEGSVTLTMKEQADQVLFLVKDTGIGIKPEDMPAVFEQFRQIDGSMTRQTGGTGLGLPISRSLVELHGGEMWVESKPGAGSTFYFTIPKEQPAGEAPRSQRRL